MTNNFSLSILLVLVSILAIGCQQAADTSSTAETVDEVQEFVIGGLMPFTGDAAAYGVDQRKIVDLALEEINSEGGVNGKPIRVIWEDGTCTPRDASSAAQKLISVDGVKVILGGVCSGETLGAAPVAESNQVILFSPASSSPDITNAGDFVFRNYPSDAATGKASAEFAIESGHTSVCVITEQTDYAQGVSGIFKDTFTELGGTIDVDEDFLSEASDFRTQLTKISESDCTIWALYPQTSANIVKVLRQAKELGIEKGLYTNELATADEALSNSDTAQMLEGALIPLVALDEDSELFTTFEASVLDKYGEMPSTLPTIYSATAYDAVYIIRDALEECGEVPVCIRDFLYGIQNREGASGLITIDENGDVLFEFEMNIVRDGTAVPLE